MVGVHVAAPNARFREDETTRHRFVSDFILFRHTIRPPRHPAERHSRNGGGPAEADRWRILRLPRPPIAAVTPGNRRTQPRAPRS